MPIFRGQFKLILITTVEEKYGRSVSNSGNEDTLESSSGSETEDDEGVLITEDLDAEIIATVNAIRSKDPKVYDGTTKFYSNLQTDIPISEKPQKQKPMYLRDYHREALLNGHVNEDEDGEDDCNWRRAPTYAEEQEDLKANIVNGMHKEASHSEGSNDAGEGEDFLVQKRHSTENDRSQSQDRPLLNVEDANKDPEAFLNNFMVSRAWASKDSRNMQPFESDDEEHEKLADAFEETYNMRFEDPERANEKLISHARDAAAKYSVRRTEQSSRQKLRGAQKQKRDMERLEREKERHRLRNLKIEEMEERVRMIKESAGLKGNDMDLEDWRNVLEADWNDEQWNREMQKRFGHDYYENAEDARDSDNRDEESQKKKRKPKKPKWDEDIGIDDIVSDFTDEDNVASPVAEKSNASTDQNNKTKGKKSEKERVAIRSAAKRAARLQRRFVEEVADASLENGMPLSIKLDSVSAKQSGRFYYRETSPSSFGLTVQDILMAEDAQLNQHAGLKKLATYRDSEKKKRDRARLSKKSRLRKWRMETFGTKDSPNLEKLKSESLSGSGPNVKKIAHEDATNANDDEAAAKKKRRRKKKGKEDN